MEHSKFIEYVRESLQGLTLARKDMWILEQAKLMEESAQQDFLMSLTGEKKITYMPTEKEIDEFCKKVQDGVNCVEYETHYYEFDTDGRYMNDWKIWHNDPDRAFPFLDRTFRGCRDLLRLREYGQARKILDKVCRLEFRVVEAADSENTESFDENALFTIADAGKEQKLSMSVREIGYDWLEALLSDHMNESPEFAGKILEVLENEICQKVNLSDLKWLISSQTMDYLETLLEKQIEDLDGEIGNISGEHGFWREKYALEKKRARSQHILLDIRKKCRKPKKETGKLDKVSVLKASWKQIRELFRTLSYERYIDDQVEIEEVWNICQALVKRGKFREEDWTLRREILQEMVSHDYYDYYGCYDPIKELAGKLYITDEETLKFADMLNESGMYARKAADLYRQYGETDKYVRYLETHLNKESREYVELIQYYCDAGNESGARGVAEQGLKKCKDDLTDLFIFLLRDAKACGDEARYKKFYASAKRRQRVDIDRVDEAVAGVPG